ncbi:MAG TPA: NADH-ubiquinone oxidoreductase-F iron-sulfur binding region domain-containing protein [Actinophytocola sp.]|uniref:NADH-ubiquinone oxidoreductase-F iron-sulfur binding region domain-containing protein n=1 Tax=Actinophytocola sp. TaxID=1872138 RepID=UPI002DBFF760|nr:NADH-ubiquinone oxidoreductase-F iron-sulfur binding region domain-containing protein [Actinophytocola sp.]HEU5470287.1 NADH-ubiquinone oxidoreductase-F iron-sulfur binding region domain-containing protein [Actinophytocola sp.]
MAYAVTTRTSRLLSAASSTLDEHAGLVGALPWRGGVGRLIADVQAAGLTGRGGAGAPTWRKLATVATTERPVVVANAADSEPASAKDVTLLTRCPHLVLDGLQLAVETVGATAVYLYVKPGPAAGKAREALAERAAKRWDQFPVRVVEAEESFVAGEESAVRARIEGPCARAFPRRRRHVRPVLDGRALLVQNVETLAHLAQIARHGPGWFRRLGTAAEPGTFLTTVSGAVAQPGVYEVPIGIPASDLIRLAGGTRGRPRAVLLGGYHGTWLPAATLGDAPLSRAGLGSLGAGPGTGVVVLSSAAQCGLAETAGIVRYLVAQRTRQCGPCRTGLPAIAARLEDLVHGRGETLPQLASLVAGHGACRHLDGAANLVRSALVAFDREIGLHRRSLCSAPD